MSKKRGRTTGKAETDFERNLRDAGRGWTRRSGRGKRREDCTSLSIESVSRPVDAIESNVPEGSALSRFACLVSLPPTPGLTPRGRMPSNNRGAARGPGRRLRREAVEWDLGRTRRRNLLSFAYFSPVKTNITGASLDRVGQRISSRFADYERAPEPFRRRSL